MGLGCRSNLQFCPDFGKHTVLDSLSLPLRSWRPLKHIHFHTSEESSLSRERLLPRRKGERQDVGLHSELRVPLPVASFLWGQDVPEWAEEHWSSRHSLRTVQVRRCRHSCRRGKVPFSITLLILLLSLTHQRRFTQSYGLSSWC